MSNFQHLLTQRIAAARRRMVTVGFLSSLLFGLCASILAFLFLIWCDLVWELIEGARLVGLVAVGATGALVLLALLLRQLRCARELQLAQSLDSAAGSDGETLTGVSLLRECREEVATSNVKTSNSGELHEGLRELAIQQAGEVAQRAELATAVPARPVRRSLGLLAALLVVVGILCLVFPDFAKAQWRRFITFEQDARPYSTLRFDVEPGDTEVRYGDDFDVAVAISGGLVERVELVLVHKDQTDKSKQEETLPMFSDKQSHWRTTVAGLKQPVDYYIRADKARSEKFQVDLILLPVLQAVEVEVRWPEYSGEPTYLGSVPAEGIAALPGTQITLSATSNRKLSAASRIVIATEEDVQTVPMQPDPNAPNVASGTFELTANASYEITLVDVDGNEGNETFRGTVTSLRDSRPFVRIIQPRTNSFATPTATIPVQTIATDDYGVSQVQLFRSLNASRPLPTSLPLGEQVQRQVRPGTQIELAPFGLEPGDTISLFARVVDNHPSGAQGSQSTVVSLKIISQEDFEMMLRREKGHKLLTEKYDEVLRHLENLANEIEKLEKEMQENEAKPDGDPSKMDSQQMQEKMKQLKKKMQEKIDALAKLAKEKLPYDLEENLNEELKKQVEKLKKMQQELDEMLEKLKNAKNDEQKKKEMMEMLAKLKKQLGRRQQEMAEATKPLEWIEKAMPLMIDQQRFVLLVARQKDLAERAKVLKDQNDPDKPQIKALMQELEEEQEALAIELDVLLEDILEHADALPDEEFFKKLFTTAQDFHDALRDSGAIETMEGAVEDLSHFRGDPAMVKIQKAADILESFLSKCKGMGGECKNCPPAFSPNLSECLGNLQSTMQQMLNDAFSSGSGSYGAGGQQGRGGNLFGNIAGMFQGQRTGRGKGSTNEPIEEDAPLGDQFDYELWDAVGTGQHATTSAQNAIPTQYRNRVGQYFQKVLEEHAKQSREER